MGSKLLYFAGKGKLMYHKRGKDWFICVTDIRVLRIRTEISALRILVGNPGERALRKKYHQRSFNTIGQGWSVKVVNGRNCITTGNFVWDKWNIGFRYNRFSFLFLWKTTFNLLAVPRNMTEILNEIN